ncbi:hypothetical protein [Mucilaginibacter glaciei]|uniref:Uncharacterized protein n=1 Tax=Mucilaginibacter glaciei TaxID=2772109 RepID=A0A926NIA2_9SPHI|nr:hypothetical protein [Mucilaginibacter glaciei]MBD1392594.1 hypothetical protein [Mucilaginibacter glaciei]
MRNTYREYQKINARIRFILLVLSVFLALLLTVCNYLNFNPNVTILILSLVVVLAYVLTIIFKFTTIIYSERIYISFWPFFNTSIKISTIRKMEVVHYDLPGFGVRYDIPNSVTYYKASGDIGLSLTLVNNKTVVIGTAKATEMIKHLEGLKPLSPPAPN